jgi:lysophospholipase L1-like esterase
MTERVVLTYGDSNTHGTPPLTTLDDLDRHGPDARWPGVLRAELGEGWRVVEEGLPGRTTVFPDPVGGVHKDGLRVLPAILESHRPIDVVVIMLGTNDLKQRFACPPVEIAEGAGVLVQHVLQSGTGPGGGQPKVLLIAPPPVLETGCLAEIFAGGAAKSHRLAAEYARIAARHNTSFLDAGAIIASSPVDGIHYDAVEHGKLGRAVAKAVKAIEF